MDTPCSPNPTTSMTVSPPLIRNEILRFLSLCSILAASSVVVLHAVDAVERDALTPVHACRLGAFPAEESA